MWYVYILYSISGEKTYTGFSNDVTRRLEEHNVTASKGFTLRYRPWKLIRTEPFAEKSKAMARERFLKTGKGREEVQKFVQQFLSTGAVSAAAEKD